ncbi:MAG TPA: S8 family serine peptidase, partial [Nocardioides sp.]|nr:S8 family serine peptidase [Nocardioides sp.]
MTVTPGDGPLEAARQRTRDQLNAILAEDPDLIVDTETGDLADFNFICDSQHVLVRSQASADRLDRYFDAALAADGHPFVDDDDGRRYGVVPNQNRDGLALRYRVPQRRDAAENLFNTMGEADQALKREDEDDPAPDGVQRRPFTPIHFMHVAPKATCCPATEPAETGLPGPRPGVNPDPTAGRGVNVVVIDTGWYEPARTLTWMKAKPKITGVPEDTFDQNGNIRPYAGHGTFVAGIIRALAPAARVHVMRFQVNPNRPGGGVREDELVDRLRQALRQRPKTHLINLSAGSRTRFGAESTAFNQWWQEARQQHPDLLVVAAAGNDASTDPFYPGSSDWAVGVGSIDRDGHLSSFTNHGPTVDVYALGRNIINAFPRGRYMGHERPNIGDERRFTRMLARWSGTSFATPVVTGLIAAEMSTH